jgi:hypothetical protein
VDVIALGGVRTLNLSYCKGVVNVSTLGQVYDLNLTCCKIVDVSVGGVHTLKLSDCEGIVDVNIYGKNMFVYTNMHHIFSFFHDVYTANIYYHKIAGNN